VLLDRSQAVFPRWLGHVSAWCAVALLPAVVLPFYKTGPFAWQGVFQFWLAALLFFGWFAAVSLALIRAVNAEPATDGPVSGGPAGAEPVAAALR
jgi:hypothetical protein